jgi:hypothetical protein
MVTKQELDMFDTEYKQVFNGIEYIQKHGNPFDRGSADSYYGRPAKPHYWPEGTGHGVMVEGKDMTPEEIVAYMAGYEWNEAEGEKKEW